MLRLHPTSCFPTPPLREPLATRSSSSSSGWLPFPHPPRTSSLLPSAMSSHPCSLPHNRSRGVRRLARCQEQAMVARTVLHRDYIKVKAAAVRTYSSTSLRQLRYSKSSTAWSLEEELARSTKTPWLAARITFS